MSRDLLITGAAGYLGSELARCSPGAAGTWYESRPPPELGEAVRIDVTDERAVADAVRALRPKAVIHTAYRQGGPWAAEVNVRGSRAVARAAAAVGARLVHVSTDLIFDGRLGRPYREEDAPHPVMEYGRQKLAAERAVLAEVPGALVVRTSLIYGGAEPSAPEQLVLEAAAGRASVAFFSDELRSPVQAGDLAAALLELVDSDAAGVLHVAGPDGVDRHEFARLVATARGADPDRLTAGRASRHPDPRPLDCRLDSTRAGGLLRTHVRGVREVLRPAERGPDR